MKLGCLLESGLKWRDYYHRNNYHMTSLDLKAKVKKEKEQQGHKSKKVTIDMGEEVKGGV
jgi:hypothetical protein